MYCEGYGLTYSIICVLVLPCHGPSQVLCCGLTSPCHQAPPSSVDESAQLSADLGLPFPRFHSKRCPHPQSLLLDQVAWLHGKPLTASLEDYDFLLGQNPMRSHLLLVVGLAAPERPHSLTSLGTLAQACPGAAVTTPVFLGLGSLSLQCTPVTWQLGARRCTSFPHLTHMCPAFPRSPQGTSWSS